jgi:hypothetical protein
MTRLHPPTFWVTARVRGLGSITLWRLAHLWQKARLRGAQWRLARGAQIHEQYKFFGVVAGLARQAVWPAAGLQKYPLTCVGLTGFEPATT